MASPNETTETRAIECSLTEHLENGLIRAWHGGPKFILTHWEVRLTNGQVLYLRTPAEAVAFCRGLASASQAHRDGRYQAAQESETGPRA